MDIKREDLLQLYYYLKLTRRLEDRATSLYHQGKILGGVWTSNGTEAVSVGYGYALEKNDIAAPYFRDMGVFLIRGITAKRIMAQYPVKKQVLPVVRKEMSTWVIYILVYLVFPAI